MKGKLTKILPFDLLVFVLITTRRKFSEVLSVDKTVIIVTKMNENWFTYKDIIFVIYWKMNWYRLSTCSGGSCFCPARLYTFFSLVFVVVVFVVVVVVVFEDDGVVLDFTFKQLHKNTHTHRVSCIIILIATNTFIK